jgi:hypothetical protein
MGSPNTNLPDLGTLEYPVYVSPIGQVEDILEVAGKILLYFVVGGRHFCYDAMYADHWKEKSCRLTYQERLTLLYHTLAEIAQYTKYIDAPYRVTNPAELKDFYKNTLTDGHKGIRIYTTDGKFPFKEEDISNTYWELFPRKVEIA